MHCRYVLKSGSYVHLRSTTPQQVDECWVEGHDGVPQVDLVLLMLFLSPKPGQQISQSDSTWEMAPRRLPFVSLAYFPFRIVGNISHFFVIDLIQINVNDSKWMPTGSAYITESRCWSLSHRSYMGKRRSFFTVGPSLAGSSDILMASSMAASRPLPPSPLRAGPKHSGRRMSSRTTTLAFSSTLSPMSHEQANRGERSSSHCEGQPTQQHTVRRENSGN